MKLKSLKRKFVLLPFLIFTLTLFFSCKKEEKELQQIISNTLANQIDSGNDLKGLNAFLNISGVDKRLRSSINTTNYHYFSKSETDQLWIIELKPGTYGFTKAKIAASLKDGQFSMIIASYKYDTTVFKKGDFSTYTGTTSIYNQKLKKLWDLVYEKGELKAAKQGDCSTCSLMPSDPPPPGYTDWCVVYPPLCDYYGTGGTDPGGPTLLMRCPDCDGGGGGGGTDPYYDPVYIDGEWYLTTDYPGRTYGFPWKWWENDVWLSDPNNFNLDLDPEQNNEYGELTAAEKVLVKAHPRAAALMWANKSIAENQTVSKMGANGLNDQSDAFRHCFFQAINTMAVGASLTQQFSDAHESEVPTQLQLEKQMDLFNNSVGIAYGQSLGFWTSVSDLADGVRGKVFNGELKYLKPINYSDPNFWGTSPSNATHGITSSTALTPTNQ